MSNPAVKQEEIEESRLPSPHLNFTGCVCSILDGDESILSLNTEVPSVPDDIVDMDIQSPIQEGNNEGIVQNTSTMEGIVEEHNGNSTDKMETTEDDQTVGTFFGLEADQQVQVLVDYKNSIHKLFSQNKELMGLLETVNQDRQILKTQFQDSLDQNRKLLEELQNKPDIDSITKEVRESLHKEYDLKIELMEENTKRDLAVKEAVFKSKMESQEKQYDTLLNTALDKVKIKYEGKIKAFTELQNRKIQQDQFRAQLDALNQELEVWKNKASVLSKTSNLPDTNVPSDAKLGVLRQDVFNYVPGTVNTNRGGAVDNTTITWDEPVAHPKKVTFVTSTPLKFDSDEVTHKDMDGLAAPLTAEHNSQNPSTISSSNTTLVNLASEFRKMREPKLQKLKGGNTSSAHLFLTGWVKEVQATIKDRELSESKGVQLIREFTESKACQQVDFFMDLNPIPTIEGVLDHLTAAFSTGEDESAIKSEFYSRKQLSLGNRG